MSQKVNLNSYFDRIGFAGSIAPTLATLETILALHPASIPFDNLDPFLGLPVELDLKSIERKLLAERRGGYCFEHNTLLAAVLRELDYPVKTLAARVVWDNPAAVELNHMLLLVEIAGTSYLADAGFGGSTPTAPLKLRADVEQATPHGPYRLSGGQPEWLLETRIGDEWKALYAFETTERSTEDYQAANLRVSTDPGAGFTTDLRVALSPSGKRLALRNTRFNTHVTGEPTQTRDLASVAELREVLSTSFGLELPASEHLETRLGAIIAKAGVED